MKRVIGLILAGLGGFLLVLALALRFWVVPAIAKAPLSPGEDTDGVTVTLNEGTAEKLFDPGTLSERTNVPLVSTRFTRGDVEASQTSEAKDQDLAVYDSFSRLTDPEGTVVNADTLRVAFNRVSSELANCCGANYNGQEVTFEGINPLKFPMFTQQQDYQYFDTSLGKAWPAVYQGEEQLDGATVYKFVMTIPPTKTGELEVPGDLVGSTDASFKAGRYYANVRTLYVEPTTGSIVKGVEEQNQTLRGPDGTDAVTIIKATIGAPDSEVQKSVDSAMESANQINLLKNTVPLWSLILGALALIGGLLLARRPREDDAVPAAAVGTDAYAPSSYQPAATYNDTVAVPAVDVPQVDAPVVPDAPDTSDLGGLLAGGAAATGAAATGAHAAAEDAADAVNDGQDRQDGPDRA